MQHLVDLTSSVVSSTEFGVGSKTNPGISAPGWPNSAAPARDPSPWVLRQHPRLERPPPNIIPKDHRSGHRAGHAARPAWECLGGWLYRGLEEVGRTNGPEVRRGDSPDFGSDRPHRPRVPSAAKFWATRLLNLGPVLPPPPIDTQDSTPQNWQPRYTQRPEQSPQTRPRSAPSQAGAPKRSCHCAKST